MMHYEDDSLISYKQENPKKQPSKAYHRYEKYKSAKTIKEARELGAGIHDFRHDHSKGFMTVKDARGNVIQPPVPVKKELEEEPEAAEENPVPEQPGNLPGPAAKAKAAAKAANKRKSIASGSSNGKQPKVESKDDRPVAPESKGKSSSPVLPPSQSPFLKGAMLGGKGQNPAPKGMFSRKGEPLFPPASPSAPLREPLFSPRPGKGESVFPPASPNDPLREPLFAPRPGSGENGARQHRVAFGREAGFPFGGPGAPEGAGVAAAMQNIEFKVPEGMSKGDVVQLQLPNGQPMIYEIPGEIPDDRIIRMAVPGDGAAGVGAPPGVPQELFGGLVPDRGEIPGVIPGGKGQIPGAFPPGVFGEIPGAVPGGKGGIPGALPGGVFDGGKGGIPAGKPGGRFGGIPDAIPGGKGQIPGVFPRGVFGEIPAAIPGGKGGIPRAFPGGVFDGIPDASPGGKGGIPGAFPGGVFDGIPDAIPGGKGGIPGAFPGGVFDGIPAAIPGGKGVPGAFPGGVFDGIPDGIPGGKGIPAAFPGGVFDGIRDAIPGGKGGIPAGIPGGRFGGIPDPAFPGFFDGVIGEIPRRMPSMMREEETAKEMSRMHWKLTTVGEAGRPSTKPGDVSPEELRWEQQKESSNNNKAKVFRNHVRQAQQGFQNYFMGRQELVKKALDPPQVRPPSPERGVNRIEGLLDGLPPGAGGIELLKLQARLARHRADEASREARRANQKAIELEEAVQRHEQRQARIEQLPFGVPGFGRIFYDVPPEYNYPNSKGLGKGDLMGRADTSLGKAMAVVKDIKGERSVKFFGERFGELGAGADTLLVSLRSIFDSIQSKGKGKGMSHGEITNAQHTTQGALTNMLHAMGRKGQALGKTEEEVSTLQGEVTGHFADIMKNVILKGKDVPKAYADMMRGLNAKGKGKGHDRDELEQVQEEISQAFAQMISAVPTPAVINNVKGSADDSAQAPQKASKQAGKRQSKSDGAPQAKHQKVQKVASSSSASSQVMQKAARSSASVVDEDNNDKGEDMNEQGHDKALVTANADCEKDVQKIVDNMPAESHEVSSEGASGSSSHLPKAAESNAETSAPGKGVASASSAGEVVDPASGDASAPVLGDNPAPSEGQ